MSRPTPKIEHFLDRPLLVAAALGNGGCGGSHVEAYILVSAVISSVASFVWSEKVNDRRRFVEAWTRFAGPASALVSLPLLIPHLQEIGRAAEATELVCHRPMFSEGIVHRARVVTGSDVDSSDTDLNKLCPSLDLKTLRAFSYPAIFYEHVRCALVHEYGIGPWASLSSMTQRDEGVSYANHMGSLQVDENAEYGLSPKPERRIHFHIGWLIDRARAIARAADIALAEGRIEPPTKWWIDG